MDGGIVFKLNNIYVWSDKQQKMDEWIWDKVKFQIPKKKKKKNHHGTVPMAPGADSHYHAVCLCVYYRKVYQMEACSMIWRLVDAEHWSLYCNYVLQWLQPLIFLVM